MRLLLRESVDNLGTIGDIVSVRDGFGRNYLVPKGIAVSVTPENLRMIEQRKQYLIEEEAKKRGEMQKIAAVLADKQFTIKARASGDEGKLYGSVGPVEVAGLLAEAGFVVEPKMVLLDKPIKELGIFDVRIRLFSGVECTTKVWVVEDAAGEPGE
jgi:large subunit ribosomal protein L9